MSTVLAIPDTRRRTADHPKWSAIKSRLVSALSANIRSFVRALRAGESDAANQFITKHIQLLADGYKKAAWLGVKEYWSEVSLRSDWVRQRDITYPNLTQHLSFYAPSVAKMAREIADIVKAQQMQLADDDPFVPLQPRVGLQADLTWSAFQDGYGNAIAYDDAAPYLYLYWEMEPLAHHCNQCPIYAAGSPYKAPGMGGTQLNAVPGDGHTECGANCKCDLHYDNSPDDNTSADWSRVWSNAPASQFAGLSNKVVDIPHGTLNDRQKASLDYYRKAVQIWQKAPYAPDLGTMFNPSVTQIEWWRLTDEQRRALQMISGAIEAWNRE